MAPAVRAFLVLFASWFCVQTAYPEVAVMDRADPDTVMAACLAENVGQFSPERACIGAIFAGCPGSAGNTQQISACLDAEIDYWDMRLNAAYRAVSGALSQEADVDALPDGVSRRDLFRKAQKGWIAYSTDSCELVASQFRGGSMERLGGLDCMMRMTAERVIELDALLESLTR